MQVPWGTLALGMKMLSPQWGPHHSALGLSTSKIPPRITGNWVLLQGVQGIPKNYRAVSIVGLLFEWTCSACLFILQLLWMFSFPMDSTKNFAASAIFPWMVEVSQVPIRHIQGEWFIWSYWGQWNKSNIHWITWDCCLDHSESNLCYTTWTAHNRAKIWNWAIKVFLQNHTLFHLTVKCVHQLKYLVTFFPHLITWEREAIIQVTWIYQHA